MAERKTTKKSTKAAAKKEDVEEKIVEDAQPEIAAPAFVHTPQDAVQIEPGEDADAFRDRLQAVVTAYEDTVSTATNLAEMELDYQEINRRKVEYRERLKMTSYNLPESSEYDGKVWSRKEIGDKIVFFITKDPIVFGDIKAMREIRDYWINPQDTVTYSLYDRTVKILDNIKYRGVQEWEGVLAVSAFFGQISGYTADNIVLAYWDAKAKILEGRAASINPNN